MCVFEPSSPAENMLRLRCANNYLPFCGGLELIPECSFNYNFTEIQKSRYNTLDIFDSIKFINGKEWIRIIDDACAMGVYSLLFSGGEPMLHPDFRKIYAYAAKRGIAVSLATNGLLIDTDMITFFRNYGCRKITIVLHGTDNETYESIFGLSTGFDRVIQVLKILKNNGISVNISCRIVPENMNQIEKINMIGNQLCIPV